MKTIISIIEVVLFNLLPAPVAAPLVNMIKDIIPMLGIILIRLSLYMAIWSQRLEHSLTKKIHQAKLLRMDNFSGIGYLKKLRA